MFLPRNFKIFSNGITGCIGILAVYQILYLLCKLPEFHYIQLLRKVELDLLKLKPSKGKVKTKKLQQRGNKGKVKGNNGKRNTKENKGKQGGKTGDKRK